MSTSKNEPATININLNGLNEASSSGSSTNKQGLWPWPWPFPFPFPIPQGPFGPGPIFKSGGSGMDSDDVYYKGITIGLSMKVQKGYKVSETHEHLCEDVLPKLMKAQSMEEIDMAFEKAYQAYPNLKEQVHSLYNELGGNQGGDVQAMNPIVWWIVKVVVRVVVTAVVTAVGAKPAK